MEFNSGFKGLIMFVRGVVKMLTAKDKSEFILLIQCLLFWGNCYERNNISIK
jgi:hypothetical protein